MSDRLVLILSKEVLPRERLEKIKRAVKEGDFWLITSDPMATTDPNKKAFCFFPTEGLDVPMRVGLCINAFLQWHGYEGYKWILKIDSDMEVPEGFFDRINSAPDDIVYGCGSVAAISVKFFKTYLKGCYPVNSNDDGFLFSSALAYGKLEYVFVPGPLYFIPSKAYQYGIELYRYGFPFWLILIQRNKIVNKPFLAIGWLYGWITRQKKYSFSSLYRKETIRRVRKKIAKLFGMDDSEHDILLVSSSKIGGRFPQRSDHLLRAFRELRCEVAAIESFNPFLGILKVLGKRARYRIFSGFRAGLAGLFLSFFGMEWAYDLVEIKFKLCSDNWNGIKKAFIPLIDRLERLMIKRAKIVFLAGNSGYGYARSVRPDVILVPNGYDDSIFDPNKYNRDDLRAKYGINFPLAIYIGKLIPMYAKFLIPAIDAISIINKELPDAEFWIYGDGLSRMGLEDKVREKGCKTKLKGYIEHTRVPEILAVADAGIHAYDTESLKLIEWLAMGLPVIAPKGLNFEGVIECEWAPEEIAKHLINIFKNPRRNPKKMPTWREAARSIVVALDRTHKTE